ncbi:MAG: MerR family transcriptional regulator [Agrobacterium tumefaciens]
MVLPVVTTGARRKMQIGDLSEKSGVNIETIRYYERIGVLPIPTRMSNGRRTYRDTDAQRLCFIRNARELGFDLAAVRVLLALQEQPEASCENASRNRAKPTRRRGRSYRPSH